MATTPYWDESTVVGNSDAPDILAVGDSWFSYVLNNLLNPVNNFWHGRYAVLAVGGFGETACQLTGGKGGRNVGDIISAYRARIRMILFSGGGNDITGESLQLMLRPNCGGAVDFRDCFRAGQPAQQFADVQHACNQLIALREANGSSAIIIAHDYDYGIPTGKDGLVGRRLKGPLDDHGVPDALRQPLINHLIHGLTETFAGLRLTHPNKFDFVHTAGTLAAQDWGQEAHPTPGGFEKLARQKWRDALNAYLPM